MSHPIVYTPTRGTRLEYERRVNRVMDHVRAHLAEPLPLAALAGVAALSPFHFHRVFQALTGETPAAHVQRQRLEKAAGTLRARPGSGVLEIAVDHGFGSAAAFARAFRGHFGMSASAWRAGGAGRWQHRRRQVVGHNSKTGKAARTRLRHAGAMRVHLVDLPSRHVAYLRYIGPYGAVGIPGLWARLRRWMVARGIPPGSAIRLGASHDDAAITDASRCTYDACVVVSRDFVPDAPVTLMDVPGGRCAVAAFAGGPHEIEDAWGRLFERWLPHSGYQPDDRPCIEIYHGAPADRSTGTFRCELALPVRPL